MKSYNTWRMCLCIKREENYTFIKKCPIYTGQSIGVVMDIQRTISPSMQSIAAPDCIEYH